MITPPDGNSIFEPQIIRKRPADMLKEIYVAELISKVIIIAPGIYQYTSVDDCSRWRVLEICKRRTANNTLHFLELILEQFPFSIQRIQTDRGLEFFAEKVQLKMMELGIKFRPNKPDSPHLNGKSNDHRKLTLKNFMLLLICLILKI